MNKIINKENANNYTWGENCKSYILNDNIDLCVKLETMPPNTTEQLHFHSQVTQVFFILKGTATMLIDKNNFELKPSESITILPKQQHFIKNKTNEVIEFLVVSQPSTNNDRTNIADI